MAEPPGFWSFLVVNSLPFIAGGSLTALSYRAYLRVQQYSLRFAAGSFALIILSGLLDIIYQLGVRQDYSLGAHESLAPQTLDSPVITAGLVAILYVLFRYWLFTREGCRTLCFELG